jgi:hypothetical protein
VDECNDILLHCNILCSQLSFTANMKKKKTLVWGVVGEEDTQNCYARKANFIYSMRTFEVMVAVLGARVVYGMDPWSIYVVFTWGADPAE